MALIISYKIQDTRCIFRASEIFTGIYRWTLGPKIKGVIRSCSWPGRSVKSPAGLDKIRGPFGSPFLVEETSDSCVARYYVQYVHTAALDPVEGGVTSPAGLNKKRDRSGPLFGSKKGDDSVLPGTMYICTYSRHTGGTRTYNYVHKYRHGGTSVHLHSILRCDTIYIFCGRNSALMYTIYRFFSPGSTRHSSPPVATR